MGAIGSRVGVCALALALSAGLFHAPDAEARGSRDWRGHGHGYGHNYRHRHGSNISFNFGYSRHGYYRHHRFGHHVSVLPSNFISLSVGGSGFYYSAGTFYRPWGHDYVVVRPPVGAVVYSLPPTYRVVHAGSHTYYHVNDGWYSWDRGRRAYVVVEGPSMANVTPVSRSDVDTTVYVYPRRGQSAAQTSRDRYECYQWAVGQSGFDPSRSRQPAGAQPVDYNRANAACLSGRGYSVQ